MLEEHKSKHSENLLAHEGDVVFARENYYRYRPANLEFLLKKRFSWMNDFIKKGDKVLEVGCGTGISRDFIRPDCNVLVTDFASHPWVMKKVDALDTDLKSKSFDAVYCSNMIHHVPFPKKFFKEMARILKPKGKLIVQEINCSFMMRILLLAARHEGWSFRQDPYSLSEPCTDKNDLWSANCAIPNLLFDDIEKFHSKVPEFGSIYQKYSEFSIFPLSGGGNRERAFNQPAKNSFKGI